MTSTEEDETWLLYGTYQSNVSTVIRSYNCKCIAPCEHTARYTQGCTNTHIGIKPGKHLNGVGTVQYSITATTCFLLKIVKYSSYKLLEESGKLLITGT